MIRTFLKGNLLLMGMNFAVGIYVARAIGPGGRGIIALVGVWPTMLLYWLNLSLPSATSYFLPRLSDRQRRAFAGSVLLFSLAVGTVVGVILWLVAARIFRDEAARYLPLVRILMLLTPLGAITEMGTNLLLGMRENRFWSYVRVAPPLTLAAGVLISLLLRGRFPLTVPVVLALNTGGGILMTLLVLIRVCQVCGIGRPGEGAIFREALVYGLKSHLTSIAGSLNQSLDQLLLGTFIGPQSLGLYVMAVNFSNLLSPITTASTAGVVAHLSYLEESERKPAALETARKTTVLLLLGTVGLALLTPMIPVMYGHKFQSAIGMALLLLPGVCLRAIGGVLMRIVMAFNQPLKASLIELAGLAVTLPMLLVLLPLYHGYGAAMASTLAYATGWLVALMVTARVLQWPVRHLLSPLPWKSIPALLMRRQH